MPGRPLPPGEFERRRRMLAPLFAYWRSHGISGIFVARLAGRRHGLEITRVRLSAMRRGACLTQAWFVAECCRVMSRAVEEVMGAAWIAEFGSGHAASEQGQRKAS